MNENNLHTKQTDISENENIPVDALVGLPPLQLNEIYNGDSFELCKRVPAKTVDLILEDMPYNITACDWDVKIDLELYWKTRLRVLKPTGVIVLTASQPFTTDLIASNKKMFKYEAIYVKPMPSNPLVVNKTLLKYHENILIFYEQQPTFNPQTSKKNKWNRRNNKLQFRDNGGVFGSTKMLSGDGNKDYVYDGSIIDLNIRENGLHPTQKPVGLFEYLIRTYTNEGDLVFDGFGGSGTTAVAAHKSKRNFIVIEKEKKYFDLAKRRLDNERAQLTML